MPETKIFLVIWFDFDSATPNYIAFTSKEKALRFRTELAEEKLQSVSLVITLESEE